jgi:hypothetical protein
LDDREQPKGRSTGTARLTLAVVIAAVGDVRRCGEGPDRRRADSLFTLSAVLA